MNYNKVWNKKRQQYLLQMNKDGKTPSEIREYFGPLLQYHPNKLHCNESFIISRFNKYNKSVINKFNKTDYIHNTKYSLFYNFKRDHIIDFTVNNIDYVLILFYLIDGEDLSYNIVFTTKTKYIEYNNLLENFLQDNEISDIDEDLYFLLSNTLEEQTKSNNPNKIMNTLAYILNDIYNKHLSKNILFSIGSTKDIRKIKWYRHIIKYSFDDVIETEKIDSIGNKIYYYDLKNIKLKNRTNKKLK